MLSLSAPPLAAEVISPGNQERDFRDKRTDCICVWSLLHYIVLEQDEMRAWIWSRCDDDWAQPAEVSGRDGVIALSAWRWPFPGCRLSSIFQRWGNLVTLKARVIPCLDVKDGRVVKGVNFVDLIDAGDPVEAAKAYDAAGADELCFLDIMASHEGRSPIFDVVRQTAEHVSCP